MKAELDLSNYKTKADLKNQPVSDTSNFARKVQLESASIYSDVGKLDTDKLKNIPSNLHSLKTKVDKLNVDKLVPSPVDSSKLSDAVKNNVVKRWI